MEVLLELILEIFGEALLQVVFEAMAEVGIHITTGKGRRERSGNPWLLGVGYVLLGLMCGGASLFVLPYSMAHSNAARVGTLILAPLAAAMTAVGLGAARARRGQQILAIDRICYAYLFALAIAIVRLFGT